VVGSRTLLTRGSYFDFPPVHHTILDTRHQKGSRPGAYVSQTPKFSVGLERSTVCFACPGRPPNLTAGFMAPTRSGSRPNGGQPENDLQERLIRVTSRLIQ